MIPIRSQHVTNSLKIKIMKLFLLTPILCFSYSENDEKIGVLKNYLSKTRILPSRNRTIIV
jgi:hypothetical protein